MNDPKDVDSLNRILNRHGIHFEKNMFDQPYVIVEHSICAAAKSLANESKKRTGVKAGKKTAKALNINVV